PVWIAGLGLSRNALRVLIVLASYADPVSGEAYPSLKTIAELSGLDRRDVRRAVDELTKGGLLTCQRRFDEAGDLTSTLYRVTIQVGVPAPPPGGADTPTVGVPAPSPGGGARTPLIDHGFEKTSEEGEDARASRLPADWQPNEGGIVFAQDLGLDIDW